MHVSVQLSPHGDTMRRSCLMPWARQDHSCCSAWLAEGEVSGALVALGSLPPALSQEPGSTLKLDSSFLGCGQGKEAACVPSYVCAVTPRGPA